MRFGSWLQRPDSNSSSKQTISNSEELSMKKPLYVSNYWAGISTGILGMAFWAAIFVVCVIFLHFNFLTSPLWWCFFFLEGLAIFLISLGVRGHRINNPVIWLVVECMVPITTILSFIFFWWQGGVAIIISCIIWFFFVFSLLNSIVRASTFTPSDNPNNR